MPAATGSSAANDARLALALLLLSGACADRPDAAPTPDADESVATAVGPRDTLAPDPGRAHPGLAAGGHVLDVDWRATGTEPFWGATVTREALTVSRMGLDDVVLGAPVVAPSDEGFAFAADSATLFVRPAACSDGMSDRQFAWSAELSLGAAILRGCAVRDPLPPDPTADEAIAAAGLAEHVAAANRTLNTGGRFERIDGTLGEQDGAEATYVAWFDGGTPVAIDFRILREGVPLFESTYFYTVSLPDGEIVLQLVDSDSWDPATGSHTAYLMGFETDGEVIGGTYSVDGEARDPPPGLVRAELAGAEDLLNAAVRARATR